jgi:signal transduction histidine kinase
MVGVVLAARAVGEPPFSTEDVAALEMVMPAVAEAVAAAQAHEARRRSRAAPGAWRTERQLREDVARLQGALRVGGVVAFEFDPSTASTTWTGDVEAAFGFAAAGAGSRLDGWIGRVHPNDRPRLRDALGADDPTPRRLRIRMADRKQAPRLFHVSVVPAGRGRLFCVLREAEPPMVREVEVVKERPAPAHDPAMLTTFIRAVRHELGGPLSVIAAEAQRLENEWIVQAEAALEGPVQTISAAAHRLGALAERLAAIEADPGALVVTGEGAVALHPAPNGETAEAESAAAASVA